MNTVKTLIMIPTSIALYVGSILLIDYIIDVTDFNSILTIIIGFVSMIISSVIIGTIFLYYCDGDHKMYKLTVGTITLTSLYLLIFEYGIDWFSLILIFYPFFYTSGVKYSIKNNFKYQLRIGFENEQERFMNEINKKIDDSKK